MTNTTKKGVLLSYLGHAVTILGPFVLVPLYVRFLGQELYGVWLVIITLTGYLGVTNFGIAQTVANMVAGEYANSRTRNIQLIISTSFYLYSVIAILILILTALSIYLWSDSIIPELRFSIEGILLITVSCFLLSLPFRIHQVALRSFQRVDLEQSIGITFGLLRIAGLTLALYLGFKLLVLSIIHGGVMIAAGFAAFLYSVKINPAMHPSIRLVNRDVLKKLLKPSFGFFTLQLSGLFAFGVDNIVIGHYLGPSAVPQYAIPFQIVIAVIGLFSVALYALMPNITALYSQQQYHEISRGYSFFHRIGLLYVLGVGVFLVLAGPALIKAWTGADIFPGYQVFGLQILFMVIQVLINPSDAILMATSRHDVYAYIALLEGTLNLVLSIWWVHLWGMTGVIGATIVARLMTNGWYMPWATFRTIEHRVRDFLRDNVRPLIIMGILILVVFTLHLIWVRENDIHTIISGVIIACAFSLVFVLLGLNRSQRLGFVSIFTNRWRESI